LPFSLFAQTQFLNNLTITVDVFLAQIVQEIPAMSDHFQKTTTGMMVFLVHTQMFIQIVDLVRQDRDLHFGRTRIIFMDFKLIDQFLLLFLRQRHLKPPPDFFIPTSKETVEALAFLCRGSTFRSR
jgi:hypothetical protein